jgi:hypothetical protein
MSLIIIRSNDFCSIRIEDDPVPLKDAIEKGNTELVTLLNFKFAVIYNQINIAKLLLKNGQRMILFGVVCMKLIFLDIDGVLVTSNSLIPSNQYFGHTFDKTCVQNLVEILNATGAKVVISSSWREGRTLAQLQSIFKSNGIEDCVIGLTPSFDNGTIRGTEIKAYLDGCNGIDCFVIIDDEEKTGDLEPFLIETEFRTGITERIKDEVISRLIKPN